MGYIYCPSLMCADFAHLKEEIDTLQSVGADIIHVDMMDGQYVENFGMGMQDLTVVCKEAVIPIEVHLMILRPEYHISKFLDLGIDILYFHPDAVSHPAHLIDTIHKAGKKAGIVLNPETSIAVIEELLYIVDYVMVMMVNPGFSGNMYLPYVEEKVKKLCNLKAQYDFEIEIDGGVDKEVIRRLGHYGADRFVLGTTVLFGRNRPYKEIFDELDGIVNEQGIERKNQETEIGSI